MIYRIFLILFSFSSFGQLSHEKITVADFNKDGFKDTLKIRRGYIQIINGISEESYELFDNGCSCDIKQVVSIPLELGKAENRPFLETMKKELLPKQRSAPDPSLKWMIKGAFLNIKLNDNPFFSHIYDSKLPWNKGRHKNIDNYYIKIKGDTLNKLKASFYVDQEQRALSSKGFLVYYAHNHYRLASGDSIMLVDKNDVYNILRTSHGVIAEKEGFYKWLFVSDYTLTGAPEKLRWESIKNATLFDKHIIVEQSLPPDKHKQFFVINIETGICGLLKEDLIVDKQDTHRLKMIFKELEKHYISNE
ncbi:hypothetical protein ACWGOQ_0018940 [Aquimarina sp. M1]